MNRGLLLVVAALIGMSMYKHSQASPEATPSWVQQLRDEFNLKIKKIEALITLMKTDKTVSEPLTEQHLELPIKSISMVAVPAQAVPGMEPAKEPVPSKPVAQGHWETRSFGWRGRQTQHVWVPAGSQQVYKPTYQYNYSSGGCSNGSCGRGGIF